LQEAVNIYFFNEVNSKITAAKVFSNHSSINAL